MEDEGGGVECDGAWRADMICGCGLGVPSTCGPRQTRETVTYATSTSMWMEHRDKDPKLQ